MLTEEHKTKLALIGEAAGDNAQAAIAKAIMDDFDMYRARNLFIRAKDGRVIPFELNWAQQILVDRVMSDIAAERPSRYILLKARQLGMSTVIEALAYWWTATHKNVSTVIMAHESEASKNLYEMFRLYYQNSHPTFRPSTKYNTKKDLTFDVEDDIKAEAMAAGEKVPGLGSKILTSVAKEGSGRGSTNQFVHFSEAAFYEDQADVVSGIMQTIPYLPRTFAFLESTANGVGTYFFNEWMSAEKGESNFVPFFLPWWKHPEYEGDALYGQAPYSDYERELMPLFAKNNIGHDEGCRKIAWARRKQLDFKTDPKKFFQEYPHTPMAAFLSSGNYAFPVEAVMAMQEEAKKCDFIAYMDIIKNDDRTYSLKETTTGPLKVWCLPEKGRKYVIGGDVAEGIEVSASSGKEGDYSVATVMDVKTRTVVARWRGHIDPDMFGDVLFELGMLYNGALIGPEVNNHGIVVLQKLINRFYRNLYRRETSEDQQFQEPTSTMGFKTTRSTKPLIIKQLAASIRERDIVDWDLVSLGELMTYMQDERGVYNGHRTAHDDCVMSLAIALYLAQWDSYDVEYAKTNVQKDSPKIKKHGSKLDGDASDRVDAARSARRSARASARSTKANSGR